jgi:hypothetical protein
VYAVGTIKRPEQVFATRLLKQLALSDEQDSGVAVTAMHGQLKALYNSQRDPSCPEVVRIHLQFYVFIYPQDYAIDAAHPSARNSYLCTQRMEKIGAP